MLPDGCIPTLITPFDGKGGIDYDAVDALVEWHMASGCVGLFSPCLSSEMFELTPEERLGLAAHVKKRLGGRGVCVATGTYGGSIEDQAEFVNQLAPWCDAVVVNTATLVPEEADDEAWQEAASRLLELTGSVPLGLYECPVPYKRLLTPALIGWCARTGRFHFHKDTSCSMEAITAKLEAIKSVASPFRFYNANVETLLPSIRAGGNGFSGISANFYPHLLAWLCTAARREAASAAELQTASKRVRGSDLPRAVQREVQLAAKRAPEAALERVQDFFALAEATVCVRYPASAKQYLSLDHGLHSPKTPAKGDGAMPMLTSIACRTKGPDGVPKGDAPFLEHQLVALRAMWRMQRELSAELGIA